MKYSLPKRTRKIYNLFSLQRTRCFEKYRRHLSTHETAGELTMDDINRIIFEDLVENGLNTKPLKRKICATFITKNQSIYPFRKQLPCHKNLIFRKQMIELSLQLHLVKVSKGCHLHKMFFSSSLTQTLIQILITGCLSQHLLLLCFIDADIITKEFQYFMQRKGGGGRRSTPVKGDISSFRCFIRQVGWEHFWDHNILNEYITSATCSPSTS